jgi:hypothetical protein
MTRYLATLLFAVSAAAPGVARVPRGPLHAGRGQA